jgi:hypothetical protein
MQSSIFVGYDPREAEAFGVCRHSLRKYAPDVPVHAVVLDELREAGLYWRPTSVKDGRLWDDISDAPMSTEFAVSRFLVPLLSKTRYALFIDCDFIARGSLDALFAQVEADPSKAVWCVKHQFEPPAGLKMDGQLQTLYRRKNWSSSCVFDCDHPSNKKLTVDLINSVPGRALHAFTWLRDDEIGELSPEYNYLVGHTKLPDHKTPKLVHFTEGGPWFAEYRHVEFADEWRAARCDWLSSSIPRQKRDGKNNVGAQMPRVGGGQV